MFKNHLLCVFRAINLFILWVRQHGSPREKNAAINFDFVSSTSSFMELVLHPKVPLTSASHGLV